METYYQVSVGIIYFSQMAALVCSYKKTNDKNILYDSAGESRLFFFVRAVWAFAVVASVALYVIFPPALRWSSLNLNNTIRVVGIIMGTASDLLIVWTLASLGKNISAALKMRDDHRLVTEGPYRYVRHPLYTAGLPLFFSISLVSSNWFLGLIGIGFQLFLMLVRTPMEEEMLIDYFGDEYRRYIERTGAHFPNLSVRR